ncbi:MAG TPA: EscU/YscU/HrcU family type III secretion system export apparatus switch protein [Bacillota bacterium]|jgi:FlhB-like protein|nr:EscU/YscU/HrcU family type III secretion system export apparatus switch protein [Bacillota bacterium]
MNIEKRAIALRYKKGEDPAPIVLAKGKGTIAEAIMELANKAGIPTMAEPELASLLELTEVGEAIPPEAYKLAAEIIAFVWRLDRQINSDNTR